MLDFNLVNVESQSQVGKTMEASKHAAINMDIKDYSSLIPLIKQVQNDSSKILKQFQEYMGKRDKKGISLPYNMIKKFEVLKQRLVSTSDLLYIQSQFYRSSVGNRDLEKKHEQEFYKKVLISYDQRRRWMKQYILRHQDKMQLVEEEVKKCPEYETHNFTQFRNQINFERIQHNYEDKLNLLVSNSHLASQNSSLRKRIKDALQKKRVVIQKVQNSNQQTINLNNNRTSFLYFYLTKQLQKKEWMKEKLNQLIKSNYKLNHTIKSFKNSLQIISKKSAFETLQYNIHIYITLGQRKKKIGEDRWSKETERNKITNTDYLIYLRDIHKKCEERIKLYGYYFQYSLQNSKFPNKFKSKSLEKIKTKKISSKLLDLLKKSHLKQMIIYKQQQNQRLVMQKKERQQRRQRLEIQKKIKSEQKREAEEIKEELLSDLSNINTVIKEEEKESLDEIN